MDIVSSIPGRLRVRLDGLYKNRNLASNLYTKLYSISNIYFVKINIYTSTILIFYDSKNFSQKDLLSDIRSCFNLKYEKNNLLISTPYLEDRLFILLSVCLILITGEYSITLYLLLLISLYKAILCILNNLIKENLYKILKKKKNKWLLSFNPMESSKSIILNFASIKLLSTDVLLINSDKLDKISAIDTVVIDKVMDNTDIETSFIENLREQGILNIHVLSNNYNIENQAKSLDLESFRLSINQEENTRYIESLKKENKVVAFIGKKPIDEIFLNETDIKICICDNLDSVNTKLWDLVIPSYNFNALGEALDYCKFTLENMYQNKLIYLWINIIGILLALSQRLNLVYSWLLLIASKILVYINSLRLLNYEPTYM